MSVLTEIITSPDPAVRNRSLDTFCQAATLPQLLDEAAALEALRHQSDNLYERVRALFFLYALHRFHLPLKPGMQRRGLVPFEGYALLLDRRFEEAIGVFLQQHRRAPSEAISSISSKEIFGRRRAFGSMRGSVV